MYITDKQRQGLREFTKDELIDYIEQLITKIELYERRQPYVSTKNTKAKA